MPTWLPDDSPLIDQLWQDSATLEPETVVFLLDVAEQQCRDFAPDLEDGASVPVTWQMALLLQAQSLHRAGVTGPGDLMNAAGETVTVYPMDWTVQGLLRPRRIGRML